jgi:hypothetical protein
MLRKGISMIYKIKVFLSWSGKGSRSYIVADGLHRWVQKVIQLAEPFLSSDDILVGERWNGVLTKELDSSGFGILCVTKKSIMSQWLLFEAGVLSGGYGNPKRVCPYLIDLEPEDLSPPLNQFNAAVADEAGTFQMMRSLNATPEGQLVPDEILLGSFKMWWHELEEVIQTAKEKPE